MPKVIFDMSMSLDGYATASGVRPEEPMGDGGQQLHQWALGTDDQRSAEVLAESTHRVGATIAGRRTYDLSVPWWGPDGPSDAARTPLFVASHRQPEQVPEGGVYTFVSSPEQALEQARVAGAKDVDIMGADIGQQLLRARVDDLHVHLVPVLWRRHLLVRASRRRPHPAGDIPGDRGGTATHLQYAVVKRT